MSYKNTFNRLYTQCFPPDEIDPYHIKPEDEAFVFDSRTMLLSFFGVANKKRNKHDTTQRLSEVLKNLCGWESDVSRFRQVANVALAPFVLLFQVLRILFAPFANTIKLVVELLPSLLAEWCQRMAIKMEQQAVSHPKQRMRLLGFVAYGLAQFGYGLFSTIRFIARAATTPVYGHLGAYETGSRLSAHYGKFMGLLLAGVSAFISIACFMFIYPMSMMIIATASVTPAAPSFLTPILNVWSAFDVFFNPVGERVAGPFFKALGLMAIPAATAGYGVVRLILDLVIYPLKKIITNAMEEGMAHPAQRNSTTYYQSLAHAFPGSGLSLPADDLTPGRRNSGGSCLSTGTGISEVTETATSTTSSPRGSPSVSPAESQTSPRATSAPSTP